MNMDTEEFIAEKSWTEAHKTTVVHVDDLRELHKGKVLVDLNFLLYAKCSGSERLHEFRACTWCAQMADFQRSLQPASTEAGSTTTESGNERSD